MNLCHWCGDCAWYMIVQDPNTNNHYEEHFCRRHAIRAFREHGYHRHNFFYSKDPDRCADGEIRVLGPH